MALRVMAVLGLDGTGFQQGLSRADTAVRRFSRSVNATLGSRFAALFSVGAAGYAIRQTIEYADRLNDLSARTGITVEKLQKFERATEDNGSSLEELIGFFERLDVARRRALENPTGMQAISMARLGISGKELTQSAPEIAAQIGLKLKAAGNFEPFIADLVAVGSRGSTRLVAALKAGLDEGYSDLSVMSTETASQLSEVKDKFGALRQEIMANLAPALVYIVKQLSLFYLNMQIGAAVVVDALGKVAQGAKEVAGPGKAWHQKWIPYAHLMDREFYSVLNRERNAWKALIRTINPFETMSEEFGKGFTKPPKTDLGEIVAQIIKMWEDANKPPPPGGPTIPPIFGGGNKQDALVAAKQLMSDPLVRTGNFLGTGRNILESLANRQVQLLQSIDKSTKKMAEKTQEEDPLGLGGAQ